MRHCLRNKTFLFPNFSVSVAVSGVEFGPHVWRLFLCLFDHPPSIPPRCLPTCRPAAAVVSASVDFQCRLPVLASATRLSGVRSGTVVRGRDTPFLSTLSPQQLAADSHSDPIRSNLISTLVSPCKHGSIRVAVETRGCSGQWWQCRWCRMAVGRRGGGGGRNGRLHRGRRRRRRGG